MSIDYGALGGTEGGEPPEGVYTAKVVRTALVPSIEPDKGVVEFQSVGQPFYYWTAWLHFTPMAMRFSQEFLDGMGVDRSNIADDEAFRVALGQTVDHLFRVEVSINNGGYRNTTVLGPADQQTSLDDVPVSTEGLPDLQPTGVAVSPSAPPDEDDSIPF